MVSYIGCYSMPYSGTCLKKQAKDHDVKHLEWLPNPLDVILIEKLQNIMIRKMAPMKIVTIKHFIEVIKTIWTQKVLNNLCKKPWSIIVFQREGNDQK